MDYQPYDSFRRRPQSFMQRHPLGGRILVLVGFFVFLIPVLRVFSADDTSKVKTTGLNDVAVVSPILTTPSSTLPPTVVVTETATLPVVAATPPTLSPEVVAALPEATLPNGGAVPADTTAKKATSTFDIRSLPDAIPMNAPKPAATTTKPVVTTPKPVTTTAPAPSRTKPTPPAAKPVTTTTAAKPGRLYTTSEVKALIEQMWPADSVAKALDVAWKESNFQAGADNGWCCLGVFQINYSSHSRRLAARGLGRDGLFDARVNIEIALEIFREQGWSPWTTA